MSQVYDSWERLVRATLRREWLREIAQRTPSDLSLASSASFNFGASSRREISSIILPTESIGEAFELDHILRASNYFNKSNLITEGRSGDLFFGVLDKKIPVVVKIIDFSLDAMEAYCLRELEFYGKAKATHSRFVPLLGYCSDNLNNRLFLVYKYMPHLDLATSLLRAPNPAPNPAGLNKYPLRSLDWITRLKIATGVAEALSYLHHECSPPLVHRDIRASSILLDDKYEVWLGSLSSGRAQKGEKQKEQNQNRFSKFLRLPRPPKTIKSTPGIPNATCTYDVYCFGKVLLELVTGKLGISSASGEDRFEQLLPYITIHDQELVVKIVDPSLVIDEDLLKEVWTMAVVARACLNPNPSKRPLMKSVLKALESPLEVEREDFLGTRLVETSAISPRNAILLGSLWGSPSDLAANPGAQPPSGLVAKKVPPPALKRKDFPATRLVSSVETLPTGGMIYRFAPPD